MVTVTDNQVPFAQEVYRQLRNAGIRVERDVRNEKLSFKIREAQLQKIPYMLVIGDKEVEQGTVTPRYRDGKNLPAMKPEEFIDFVTQECKNFK